VTDCWALLEVLNMHLALEDQTVAQTLFDSIEKTEHQVYAIGSPFESKDLLKSRSYRWNGEIKCWSRVLSSEQALREELAWLKVNVYGHKRDAKVEIETFSRLEKYSDRPGEKRLQSLANL
jgi:DNA polymerase III subunit epsilon